MSDHQLLNSNNNETSERQLSRKGFLSLVWKSLLGFGGIIGLVGIWRFFSYETNPAERTSFDLGPVDELPEDEFIPITEAKSILIRSGDSFSAISLECPHLGCTVDLMEDGFTCPCHGSEFTFDGAVINGPAAESLRILKLEITEEGHLILNTSEFW